MHGVLAAKLRVAYSASHHLTRQGNARQLHMHGPMHCNFTDFPRSKAAVTRNAMCWHLACGKNYLLRCEVCAHVMQPTTITSAQYKVHVHEQSNLQQECFASLDLFRDKRRRRQQEEQTCRNNTTLQEHSLK
jgi:hypothetical protein